MKHRLTKSKLLLLLFSAFSISLQAQVGGNGVPDAKMKAGSSPTNSGMESIYSPNLFEGSLNIGIPIYDFNSPDGSYGLAINYNTKGIKVDEVSTPVSVHWNLLAEPSITRIVKDIPDELLIECNPTIHVPGFGVFDTANANHYIRGKYITYMESPQQQAQTDVYRDKEVDEFILSYGGRTIKFNLGSSNYIFTHPHTNLKINITANGIPLLGVPGQTLPPSIGTGSTADVSISVRDEQGNVFLFEPGDMQSERYFSTDYLNQYLSTNATDPNAVLADVHYTQRWVLKKATFSNGKEIKYFYNPRRTTNYFVQNIQSSARENWETNPKTLSFMQFSMGPVTVSDSFTQISRIEYPNGVTARFLYNQQEVTESNAQVLDAIKISGSTTECLNYIFNRTKINGRWFLNGINLQSCDGQVNEPYYSFEYNPLPLPPRLNNGQDLYGYYNGDSIANHFDTSQLYWPGMHKMGIPKHYGSPLLDLQYGVSRSYNSTMAQAGILTKVISGYGGEIALRYKAPVTPGGLASVMTLPNFFPDIFLGKEDPDGVDIDSVIEKDKYHPENFRITKFNQSGGQLFMPGGYFHYPYLIDNATNAWQKVYFQNMFLTAHDLVNGSNHGYSNVEIVTMTGSGEQLSKKVFKFTNIADNGISRYYKVPGSKDYFEYPYTDKQYLKSWELGLASEIWDYDANNRLIARTVNQYQPSQIDQSSSSYITSTKTTKVNTGTGIPVPSTGSNHPDLFYKNKKVITDTYYPFTGKALLAFTATQKYVAGNVYIYDTTRYAYDERQNLSEITTKDSKGQIDKTIHVYNYSITDPQSQITLANMNNNGIEKIVSIERWREGTGTYPNNIYSRKLLSASINTFQYQNGFLRSKAVYTSKISAPIAHSEYTGILPNGPLVNPYAQIIAAFQGQTLTNFENVSETSVYDEEGNPLETRMTDRIDTKAAIWDKPTGNKLAEAVNCLSNEIAYNGFETAATGNFDFNPNQIVPVSAIPGGGINGRYAYLITGNPLQSRILTANLTPGKEYYVTFWSVGGTPNFTGAGVSSTTFEALATKGSWTYYRGTFTPTGTGQIGFTSSSNIYLDELRIFPTTAMMKTWTYLPMLGVSAETNAVGRITYYEYDAMGRLSIVRDQEDNILSKKELIVNGNE